MEVWEYAGKDHRPRTRRGGWREELRAITDVSGCQPGTSRWEQTRGVEGEAVGRRDQAQ